eukprot:Hpha_TRINITY_DN16803_c4_g1::TRINITY_DN16803_c4_g1_i1::g.150620::m.150620
MSDPGQEFLEGADLGEDELAALLAAEEAEGGMEGADVPGREMLLKELKEFEAQVSDWRTTKKAPRATLISASLIAETSLDPGQIKEAATEEERIDAILGITKLQLGGCGIARIENLEYMTHITELYLQRNRIEKIEDIDLLDNLTALSLAHNQIVDVEGLDSLPSLGFLDLSHNRIRSARPDALPTSLQSLSFEGNPCAEEHDYREALILALPRLVELDGQRVTRHEREAVGAPPLDGEDTEGVFLTQDPDEDTPDTVPEQHGRGMLEGEGSHVGKVRERLMADYAAAGRDRQEELERVLGWETEGRASELMDIEVEKERDLREERKRARRLLSSLEGDGGGAEAGTRHGALSRRQEMAAELQTAAQHQTKLLAAEWEAALDEQRAGLRERREQVRARCQKRREELLEGGDSEAFTAARGRLLEQEQRRRESLLKEGGKQG